MSWNKFVEFIAPFKIPTEIAVSVVLLVALFLSFAPENLLVQLKLLEFIKEYQFAISIYMLIAIAYWIIVTIIHLFKWLRYKWDLYVVRKIQIEQLENLHPKQKRKILNIYNDGCTGFFDEVDPDTGYLRALNIIELSSAMGPVSDFGHFLQPWVAEYLNKEKNYKKFVKEVEDENNEV